MSDRGCASPQSCPQPFSNTKRSAHSASRCETGDRWRTRNPRRTCEQQRENTVQPLDQFNNKNQQHSPALAERGGRKTASPRTSRSVVCQSRYTAVKTDASALSKAGSVRSRAAITRASKAAEANAALGSMNKDALETTRRRYRASS
jgi:hypothetical protein